MAIDDAVQFLRERLAPITEDDDPRKAAETDYQNASKRFADMLFYGDVNWTDLDDNQVVPTLTQWFSDVDFTKLEAWVASPPLDNAEFTTWIEQLLSAWSAAEAESTAASGEGTENPEFAPYNIPGTQFYNWDAKRGVYLYSDKKTGGEWKTWDDWFAAQQAGEAADGALKGHLHEGATLPGTTYYAMKRGVYVYNSREDGGDGHGWQPYEYWQRLAAQARPTTPQPATIPATTAQQTTDTAQPPRYGTASYDDNRGMWYRYNYQTEAHEWAQGTKHAEPATDATWMTQAETVAEGRSAGEKPSVLEQQVDALSELFNEIPEAVDMPVEELYEAIMRGARARSE